jgi:hypothetical protein
MTARPRKCLDLLEVLQLRLAGPDAAIELNIFGWDVSPDGHLP